jgi:hypothetical protein
MKSLIEKLKYTLASWLYNQNITAPQILNKTSIIIAPGDLTEEETTYLQNKQKEIKDYIIEILTKTV